MSTKAVVAEPRFSDRIAFVDVLRGIAVVSMIWMHTADGWLDRSVRGSELWRGIVSFGGLAAPLFFVLAGVGLGMGWHGRAGASLVLRLRGQIDRGLQLVVLGYGLRLQMWMVDAGGYAQLQNWGIAFLLSVSYVLAYRGLSPRSEKRSGRLLIAAGFWGAGLLAVAQFAPTNLARLLRVDVLQGLGLSMVLVCLTWRSLLPIARRPEVLLVVSLLVPFAVASLRGWLPGPFPNSVAGYLATWPIPAGTSASTLFPLFPWAAYTFAGAGFALLWSKSHARGHGTRALLWTSAGGLVVAFVVSEYQPWTFALLRAWPHATQPVRVVYRAAVVCSLSVPAYLVAQTYVGRRLRELGTASLPVYWVHLQFAFGSLAHPFAHELAPATWLVGFAALTVAMVGLARAANAQVGSTLLRRLMSGRTANTPPNREGRPQGVRGP